jgi:tRNA-2-methylthio-N6-dimethylallyladenosine synthase
MLNFYMNKSVYIHTFGCQMNVHDSEKILGILHNTGYSQTNDPYLADLIVFNTCSIRQKAEQKFYSELGRIKAVKTERPEVTIAVAGCIAQQEGKRIISRAPYVDIVFGPQNIHMLTELLLKGRRTVATTENPDIALMDLPVKRTEGIRAWVTIMYGCNNFCSYCVVPFTRGRERSRPSASIISEITRLSHDGYKEITLLGQNVNSYKSDTDFAGLLKKIDRVGGVERIRFVTSHPRDLSSELIKTIPELPRVCEHIHLPLQSGADSVLARMNRRYTYDEYKNKVSLLREFIPEIAITSDIIAGFPGETEDDHYLTLKALKEIKFDGIFAFRFSPRPGTKAYEMDFKLDEHIVSERLNQILSVQEEITERKNRLLEGTVQEILIEGPSEKSHERLSGRTRTNKIVDFPGNGLSCGTLMKIEITKGRLHSLEGIAVK